MTHCRNNCFTCYQSLISRVNQRRRWLMTQFRNQILHLVQDDNSTSVILSSHSTPKMSHYSAPEHIYHIT